MSVERMWVAFYVHNGQEQQRAKSSGAGPPKWPFMPICFKQ